MLRGDAETIALKALEKDRERRYSSAAALGADIVRFLNSESITARPPPVGYQLHTFARRNKALVAGAAVAFIALLAGLIGVSVMYMEAAQARAAQAAERRRAEDSARQAIEQRNIAQWRSMIATAQLEYPDEPTRRALIHREARPEWTDWYSEARAIESVADSFLWARTLSGHLGNPYRGHSSNVLSAAWSPDGSRIATASWDGRVMVWEVEGSVEPRLLQDSGSRIFDMAWSPDGTRIATASLDGTARVLPADGDGEAASVFQHEESVRSVMWHPEGTHILTSSLRNEIVSIWQAEGVVPGGGLSLLRAAVTLESEATRREGDERTGVLMLCRALEAPTRQIAENSAFNGGVVVNKMREGEGNYGFDAARGEFVNLVEQGIIDPTKVVRIALENAVSAAGTLLLAEATMTEMPERPEHREFEPALE